MHKDGKWARQIISLQEEDGKWGYFHSLSQFYDSPITTEQALRRLECLGYTIEDPCIQKAVSYMDDCLRGKNAIPDRREKVHDWDIFTSLILSTWIRRFTLDNPAANQVAEQWAEILTCAFVDGTYDHERYVSAYKAVLHLKPGGGRLIDFVNFYPISLISGCLEQKTELAVMDYVLHRKEASITSMAKKSPFCRTSLQAEKQAAIWGPSSCFPGFGRPEGNFVLWWIG